MGPARTRSRIVDLGLTLGILAALTPQRAAGQLGEPFLLWDQQAALANLRPGDIVRLRFTDGRRLGGPLLRWTASSATIGPYMGYAERDSVIALGTVDSLWMRGYATRRGAITGGIIGTLAGLGIGSLSSSLCPTSVGNKPCAQGAVSSSVVGLLVGGVAGALIGSGTPRWKRILPRSARPSATSALALGTLRFRADSVTPDPRALVLMRARPNALVRLTFGEHPDLAGYVVSAGMRGATLALVVQPPREQLPPLDSVEAIWVRGTAARTGSVIGMLGGAGAGAYRATTSCTTDCVAVTLTDGLLGAFLGWLVGGGIGSRFQQWQRRY